MARTKILIASAFRSQHGIGSTASRPPPTGTRRAALVGAGLGGWLGLLIGLVLALLPGAPHAAALLGGPLMGATAGAVMGLLVHWATDARRNNHGHTGPPSAAPAVRHPRSPETSPATGSRRRQRPAGDAVRLTMTRLPRLGTVYAFDTAGGQRVGVLVHRGGRRDMMSFDPDDLDRVLHVTHLEEAEARTVAHLLGLSVLDGSAQSPAGSGADRAPALAGSPG
jgi:hypothetical protein